jgi:holo-[acyl-carrier-protein] synthase
MVVGTGTHIVNIDRIERLLAPFLGRVFTEGEIIRCRQKARPPECFATRFAAKEAFLKAIGWGLRNGIQWADIEVENDSMGKPLFSPAIERQRRSARPSEFRTFFSPFPTTVSTPWPMCS